MARYTLQLFMGCFVKDKVVVGSKWKQKGSKGERYLKIKSISGKNVSYCMQGKHVGGLSMDRSMSIMNLLTKYEQI